MRVEHESSSDIFLIDEREGILHETVAASIDQRPYQSILKSFSVEGVQTFVKIHRDERIHLAEKAMDELLKQYQQYNHVIESRKLWPSDEIDIRKWLHKRMRGETVDLVYDHPKFGPQAVKAQILIGRNTKITQIADVSPDALDSAKVTNFLESLRTQDRILRVNTKFEKHWKRTPSPTGLFSIYLPKERSPYFPENPIIRTTDTGEVIRTIFQDPVRNQIVIHSSYGFTNKKNFTFEEVESLIEKEFIKRHGREPSRVDRNKRIIDSKPLLYATYGILPSEENPDHDFVMLHVYFHGKNLFVQETIGPKRLVGSKFIQNIIRLHNFAE